MNNFKAAKNLINFYLVERTALKTKMHGKFDKNMEDYIA